MNTPDPKLDPKLEKLLKNLRQQAPRDPQTASRARQAFLAQAAKVKPGVSNLPPNRLEGKKENLITFWFGSRKEKNPMFNAVLSILLVLGLVFGAGATTVAAAQAATPDGTLYPIKTWSEDVRLDWATDSQAKLDLALQFSERRSAEIQNSLALGENVPEKVVARLENQQRMALNLAAGLPLEQTQPALEQIRNQARQQERALTQIHIGNPAGQQMRVRVQAMLQSQVQIAQAGLDNPAWLREQLRLQENNRFRLSTPTPESTLPPTISATSTNPGATDTPEPQKGPNSGNSQNPWIEATYTPGAGNGPNSETSGNNSPATPQPGRIPRQQPTSQPGNVDTGQSNNDNGGQPDNGNSNPAGNGNGNKP